MPAIIRVTLKASPSGPVVPPITEGVSRNDLRQGYEVTCESVHAATTYSWSLAFAPQSSGPAATSGDDYSRVDSTASLTSTTASQTKFQVDHEGSYLIRLVTDVGLGTEDVQFLRLRMMTRFAELFLMAAGERRDESGVIPVDVSAQGWANEQNSNIQRLMLLVRRASMSGRVLYVDANRGRDNLGTTPPEDPDVVVRMPGPDSSDRDESGMRIAAKGFGDFAYINDAIAYASACVSRGEAALSYLNPYVIKVAPGFYQEDLALVPHVHLIADESSFFYPGEPAFGAMASVAIQTTGNPGAHHEFTATLDGDVCYFKGILFMNSGNTTEPIFRHRGGYLIFDHCTGIQDGSDPNQGPIVLSDPVGVAPSIVYPAVLLLDSFMFMQTGNPDLYSFICSGLGVFYSKDSWVWGDSALLYNPDFENASDGGEVRFKNSWVRAMTANGYPFRGYPGIFIAEDSGFDNEAGGANPILAFELVDTAGAFAPPGSVTYDVDLRVSNSPVGGDIRVRTTSTTGDVYFRPSSIRLAGEVTFPTGAPTGYPPETNAFSLRYDTGYTDPISPVGPLPNTLPTDKVQNAIDMLVGAALPVTGAPYYSLDSAYDGLASLLPITYGDGLGREITADAGAVKIGGALTPVELWLADQKLTGGIQVEGNADIGPMVDSVAPSGALDNLGSEINLRPGTYAGASMLSMGRSVVPTDFGATHRGLPAGILMGGNPNAANATGGHVPFNLHLRTRNNYDSDTGELGRLVIGGGEAYPDFGSIGTPDTQGGGVYVQGGTCYQPSGGAPYAELGGFIFLAPGMTIDASSIGAGTTASRIRICLLDDTVGWATLDASAPFVPGGSGTFYLSGINGMEQFRVSAGDALNDVVNTINQTSYQFIAENNAGFLRITSITPGPNGDVLFVASNPTTLNTVNLGELRVGSGATFTPGSYNKYVDIACTDTDELTVYGDIHATGDITAGGTCCGGGGGGPTLDYQQIIPIAPGPPPPQHVILPATRLAGILNQLAVPAPFIVLPLAPADGREVTVKDESGTCGAWPVTIITADGSTIQGVGSVAMTANWQSFRFYFTSQNVPAPGMWMIV